MPEKDFTQPTGNDSLQLFSCYNLHYAQVHIYYMTAHLSQDVADAHL